jgi:hypothetical protein
LQLDFIPFKDRTALNLGLIFSRTPVSGAIPGIHHSRETITSLDLIGFAEEHQARW